MSDEMIVQETPSENSLEDKANTPQMKDRKWKVLGIVLGCVLVFVVGVNGFLMMQPLGQESVTEQEGKKIELKVQEPSEDATSVKQEIVVAPGQR